MQTIAVLLADDHVVVRHGLRLLLEAEGDIKVIGEAQDGREAVRLARELMPNVAVIDIAMPKLNGLEATRQISRQTAGVRVLILSSYSDDEYVRQLAMVGAAGYLVKQTAALELIRAVREIHRGHAYFGPTISHRMAAPYRGGFTHQPGPANSAPGLTSREREVLQLIAESQANKQIAAELGISIKTVEKHRQQVMDKLNIHDTAGLTRYAIAHRFVENLPGIINTSC